MRATCTLSLFALVLLGASSCLMVESKDTSPLRVEEPRCEDLRDPLAIPTLEPELSWHVETTAPERRGQGWAAFQVQVVRMPETLADGPDARDGGLDDEAHERVVEVGIDVHVETQPVGSAQGAGDGEGPIGPAAR